MAAYLGDVGFEKATCHHYGDVDVSGEKFGETYGFEYERDRSHTVEEITEKYKNVKMKYIGHRLRVIPLSHCFF